MKKNVAEGRSASALIDQRIEELGDWRGKMLARVRRLIKQADPHIVEEWKWRGTPTWSHNGIVCTGETYKSVVKMTFAKGASLKDPSRLFNSSLDGNVRRAIDIRADDAIDEAALKKLIRQAVALQSGGQGEAVAEAVSPEPGPCQISASGPPAGHRNRCWTLPASVSYAKWPSTFGCQRFIWEIPPISSGPAGKPGRDPS